MNCIKCGTPLKESAKFCSSCGYAVGQPVVSSDDAHSGSQKSKKKSPILALIIALCVALGVILMMVSGNGGAESTAKQFVEGMLDGDAKKCVSLLTDEAVEQTGCETRKILINVMEDALEGLQEEYIQKYGKNWKYEVTVIDAYEQEYEYYGGEYIGGGVEVVLEINHSGGGLFNDDEGSETETVIVVQDGRKWLVSGFGF